MFVLSGSSSPALAQEIADKVNAKLLERKIGEFPGGELRIKLTGDLTGERIILVQSMQAPVHRHLMELLLLADAAKQNGAKKVTAVIPWLAYSKQDQVFEPGEPCSAAVIAKIISAGAIDRVVLLDLHSKSIMEHFGIPVTEATCEDDFVARMHPLVGNSAVVVSPDPGGVERSKSFAKKLKIPLVELHKTRDRASGEVKIHRHNNEIKGKNCFIFDDLIATGATVVESCKYLLKQGAASVTFCATHGTFVRGWKPIENLSQKVQIIVSNSIPLAPKQPKSIKVISCANILAAKLI